MLLDKYERQLALELEGINLGIEKTKSAILKAKDKSAYADTQVGAIVVFQLMSPLVIALQEYVDNANRARNNEVTKQLILKCGLDKTAYIILREIISKITTSNITLTNMCHLVAEAVEFNTKLEDFKKATGLINTPDPSNYLNSIIRVKARQNSSKYRTAIVLDKATQKVGYYAEGHDKETLIIIGQKLLDIFIQKLGLVKLDKRPVKAGKYEYILKATDEFMDYINKLEGECELLNPILMPMVVPPLPHAKECLGGFLSEPLRIPLVKDDRKKLKKYLADVEMPKVYNVINSVQNTAWRINKKVLEVLVELVARDKAVPELDIPTGYDIELPPRPWGYLSDDEWAEFKINNLDTYKAWAEKARDTYNTNVSDKSKRLLIKSLISMATKFQNEPELYYCYDLDWRGRLYSVQSGGCPNPQGNDMSKALLEFAYGMPLGAKGSEWLSVAGANSFGDDKLPLNERKAWASLHEEQILEVAKDPFSNKWWWEANNSWKFLSFCFEWAEFVKSGYSPKFISRLPVALDGSCSGIQHFSALLLDERGAIATNVISNGTEAPSDIYAEVAKEVNAQLEADARTGNSIAIFLKGKVNRSTTKRNTMTTPYGVSARGMREQLKHELDKSEFSSDIVRFLDVCDYLAQANSKAIAKVVLASQLAMDWLKQVADVMAEANKIFYWTTPSGFRVRQCYLKPTTKRVETFWGGTRLRLNVAKDTQRLDHKKVKQGQAPNYIHSMDASHLMLTVNACNKQGIKSFALIHDSFGTHAGETEKLAQILREEFVKMYSKDNLAEFKNEIASQLPDNLKDKLPPVPTRGTLDINKVLTSTYFFG